MYTPYGFDYYAEQFAEDGICSVGVDLRGFGNSGGLKGYLESVEDIVSDNLKFIAALKEQDRSLASIPLFLIGHSMGALASAYMATRHPHIPRGMVLFSPPFHPKGKSEYLQKLIIPFIPLLGPFHKCGLRKFGLEPGVAVDDEVRTLRRDPLIYKGKLL